LLPWTTGFATDPLVPRWTGAGGIEADADHDAETVALAATVVPADAVPFSAGVTGRGALVPIRTAEGTSLDSMAGERTLSIRLRRMTASAPAMITSAPTTAIHKGMKRRGRPTRPGGISTVPVELVRVALGPTLGELLQVSASEGGALLRAPLAGLGEPLREISSIGGELLRPTSLIDGALLRVTSIGDSTTGVGDRVESPGSRLGSAGLRPESMGRKLCSRGTQPGSDAPRLGMTWVRSEEEGPLCGALAESGSGVVPSAADRALSATLVSSKIVGAEGGCDGVLAWVTGIVVDTGSKSVLLLGAGAGSDAGAGAELAGVSCAGRGAGTGVAPVLGPWVAESGPGNGVIDRSIGPDRGVGLEFGRTSDALESDGVYSPDHAPGTHESRIPSPGSGQLKRDPAGTAPASTANSPAISRAFWNRCSGFRASALVKK
jgi:hypothetical protein